MGNSKSKKVQKVQKKEPEKFFERERWKEKRLEEIKKKQKRFSVKDGTVPLPPPPPVAQPTQLQGACAHPTGRLCDDEALDRMRFQLNNDAEAFLLNNILMSVQFFENYEREMSQQRDNTTSDREHYVEEELVRHHKHVFYGDRLLQCVHDHVRVCGRKSQHEPIAPSKLFVVYDNIEAAQPGDTSDYSAVLDVPFYKLGIDDSKEQGYVKLKVLEILESSARPTSDISLENRDIQIYGTDSEFENELRETIFESEDKILTVEINDSFENLNPPVKNIMKMAKMQPLQARKKLAPIENHHAIVHGENKYIPKSIIKETTESYPLLEKNNPVDIKDNIYDDTETSGYRSNASSSRINESTETESEYGYATITESATPKPLEISLQANFASKSGVLPKECFVLQKIEAFSELSENEGSLHKISNRQIYEDIHYLSSGYFMANFIDIFLIKLGASLSLSQDTVNNALTQGASIYCQSKHGLRFGYEIIPAIVTSWPNIANEWIIRKRRIVQNSRNNLSYQWPTKYMVGKATASGCMLTPLGFRPKRGVNPEQILQWKIMFPAAERYLENCLAHSHVRCYLFALVLQKCFLQSEKNKAGIDSSHIKHHLFRQCEHNFAKWPEDRLGESLRIFLRSFYTCLAHARFPNYFIEDCNDFKSIPKPQLLKIQKNLADILEAPVMHILYALRKLWLVPKEFYPTLNIMRLYEILTSRYPSRLVNTNLNKAVTIEYHSSDSEDYDTKSSFQKRGKSHDNQYRWKQERERQMQQRRKTQYQSKNQTNYKRKREIINPKIIIPKRLDSERKRLVIEFFIPHFIAMSRMSERFDAITQAVMYLEQAQRLCILLQEESCESLVLDYFEAICEKLRDCRQKLVHKRRVRLQRQKQKPNDGELLRETQRQRPKYIQTISSESSVEAGMSHFTFADVHEEVNDNHITNSRCENDVELEESKL